MKSFAQPINIPQITNYLIGSIALHNNNNIDNGLVEQNNILYHIHMYEWSPDCSDCSPPPSTIPAQSSPVQPRPIPLTPVPPLHLPPAIRKTAYANLLSRNNLIRCIFHPTCMLWVYIYLYIWIIYIARVYCMQSISQNGNCLKHTQSERGNNN